MSQNLINSLTDDVSALRARVSAIEAESLADRLLREHYTTFAQAGAAQILAGRLDLAHTYAFRYADGGGYKLVRYD